MYATKLKFITTINIIVKTIIFVDMSDYIITSALSCETTTPIAKYHLKQTLQFHPKSFID